MLAIIDYGAGNTKSLQFALERLGVNSLLTSDADQINSADKVIFPGQGAAGSAMQKLKQLRNNSGIYKFHHGINRIKNNYD